MQMSYITVDVVYDMQISYLTADTVYNIRYRIYRIIITLNVAADYIINMQL